MVLTNFTNMLQQAENTKKSEQLFMCIYIELFYRNFGAKCSKCCRNIATTDWVRRAKEQVFHLACFSCDQCGRQLSTGEQFAMIDEQVLCKSHYYEMDGSTTASSDGK